MSTENSSSRKGTSYYRETYNELQRVMASNRFIFSQGAIAFGSMLILGPLPWLIYAATGGVLLILGMYFEGPYRLLRNLLPYGNWPAHVEPVTGRQKVFILVGVCMMIGGYFALIVFCYALFRPTPIDSCWGSVACLIVTSIF